MDNLNNKIKWILQEKYNGKLTKSAKKDIERLKRGEPLDYIIGFTEFLGCKIDLSKKPLIPRPETEFLVEKAINEDLRFKNYDLRILDLFSGSGCIGIAVLKHIKNSHVTFADSEKNALEQIKINARINFPDMTDAKRFEFILSDVFGNILKNKKFDYIFANPPYIPESRKNKVQKSVLEYEPKEALFGGREGLLYIRKFLAKAKNFLNPAGKIYMEFDSIQKNKIEKLLKKYRYKNYEFQKDQFGKFRYLSAK